MKTDMNKSAKALKHEGAKDKKQKVYFRKQF